MLQFFFFLILISSMFFLWLKHPMSMNTNLMIQAFLITIFSGLLIKSFWFSYSLFLIFLGGMLILFMYMTTVASNEKFSFKSKNLFMNSYIIFSPLILSILIFLLFMIKNPNFLINLTLNFETMEFNQYMNLMQDNNLMLNKFYNFPMNFLAIILMFYLLFTLIASVKISSLNQSTMRKIF
uniref:NADH dehydrogenase subunit 6 n=1 Tax=Stenochironomus okialbus TaxID=1481661 RepID=UPI001FB00B4E|nr:NADH dehydrogenase subunit 6 [Stenochironomus okialbus]UKO33004.1 NADH dehydrogenase subunit 6 [Stenochironomus okialbus]